MCAIAYFLCSLYISSYSKYKFFLFPGKIYAFFLMDIHSDV
jgi:hypothetical protein